MRHVPTPPSNLVPTFSPNASSTCWRVCCGVARVVGLGLLLAIGLCVASSIEGCSFSVEKVILYNTEAPATKATPIAKIGPS